MCMCRELRIERILPEVRLLEQMPVHGSAVQALQCGHASERADAPAQWIVGEAGEQAPLRAGSFAVQGIALDIADRMAIDMDVVQVRAAVEEPVDIAPIRGRGLNAIAQSIVAVLQTAAQALA